MRNTLIALALTLSFGCGGSQKAASSDHESEGADSSSADDDSTDCEADPSAPGCEDDEMSADPDEGGE